MSEHTIGGDDVKSFSLLNSMILDIQSSSMKGHVIITRAVIDEPALLICHIKVHSIWTPTFIKVGQLV